MGVKRGSTFDSSVKDSSALPAEHTKSSSIIHACAADVSHCAAASGGAHLLPVAAQKKAEACAALAQKLHTGRGEDGLVEGKSTCVLKLVAAGGNEAAAAVACAHALPHSFQLAVGERLFRAEQALQSEGVPLQQGGGWRV